MPLAGEEAARRVEADPPGTGEKRLRPRVQVDHVALHARWAVQRLLVGPELNRISGHEARRESEVAQRLDEQPREVSARAVTAHERLFRREDAGLHADVVAKRPLHVTIQVDEDVDDPAPRRGDAGTRRLDELGKLRPEAPGLEVRQEVVLQERRVGEREVFRVLLEEKVERVRDRQLGHQVDLDHQLLRRFREHQPGLVVAERILLPVDEVIARLDPECVRKDRSPAVRRRPQPHDVGRQLHHTVVSVAGLVMQGDADAQGRSRVRPRPLRPRFAAERRGGVGPRCGGATVAALGRVRGNSVRTIPRCTRVSRSTFVHGRRSTAAGGPGWRGVER